MPLNKEELEDKEKKNSQKLSYTTSINYSKW